MITPQKAKQEFVRDTPHIHHLADAYEAVARLNHYMVGVVYFATADELNATRQVLIGRQNALRQQHGFVYEKFNRALDLIDEHIKVAEQSEK
jgi:hypothetical protein